MLDVTEPDGTVPVRLKLERVYRPEGRRKQIYKARADSRDVQLIGHQDRLFESPIPSDGAGVTLQADGTTIREVQRT